MLKLLCFSLSILASAAATSTLRSYINNVGLAFLKETWRCDTLICQGGTVACHIQLKTDMVNRQSLTVSNMCIDSQDVAIFSLRKNVTLDEGENVDIDILSRAGAQTEVNTQFGAMTIQVHAIIAPEDWLELKHRLIANLTNSM